MIVWYYNFFEYSSRRSRTNQKKKKEEFPVSTVYKLNIFIFNLLSEVYGGMGLCDRFAQLNSFLMFDSNFYFCHLSTDVMIDTTDLQRHLDSLKKQMGRTRHIVFFFLCIYLEKPLNSAKIQHILTIGMGETKINDNQKYAIIKYRSYKRCASAKNEIRYVPNVW